ncbi:hypothetical protein FHW36_11845 [Chitinophaga polysaccharea]|jgi:hypothetical protein|uniref:Conjugative transposon TraK protein n=1 Tax=Chitinophaga polysaccharea TaxID=1293035 RepID=A0A561P0V0_9BACT|nr:hypothetical protein [Chitinophaga polysaccharea]TWF31751.1 hypothetical protein FHW36_11845 [Chitinophaga polysaccharea]
MKEKIIKEFDGFAAAKKNSAITVRLILFFCLCIIIVVVFFSFQFAITAIRKIIVVDRTTGEIMKVSSDFSDKLFRTQMETHCGEVVYYCNSFDRLKITEYQARTLFLVSKSDAFRIFSRYKEQRAYADAIDRGLEYKAEFIKIDQLQADKEPYRVRFTSRLQIFDNDRPIKEYLIESEGEVRRQTPQFPENKTGFYFTKYIQTYKAQEVKNE